MNTYTILSDPGIDDIIALALIRKLAPSKMHHLISTFGNAVEPATARNAKEFIAAAARHWTYSHGTSLPMNGKVEHPWPDYFHGPDGVWGMHPPASSTAVKHIANAPENSHVLSLSPMHDTLHILRTHRHTSYTVMGGAFNIPGNETEFAETNIAFDTDAADEFFSRFQGSNVRVVPLDVTRKVFWDISTVRKIPTSSVINAWIKNMLLTWFEKYTHQREEAFNLHDPLAAYLSVYPDAASWTQSGISVVTEGKKRGQTIFSDTNPACMIALGLTDPEKISEHIFSLMF